jgi:hypothetical protein
MFPQSQPGQGLISQDEFDRRFRELQGQRQEALEHAGYVQSMQRPQEVAPRSPFAAPSQVEPEPDASVPGSVGGVIRNTGTAVVRGAAKAIDETVSFFTFGKYRPIGEENLPEQRSDSAVYGFIEGMSQFSFGMLGASKVLAPLKIGKRAYTAARAAGVGKRVARPAAFMAATESAGFVTDFVAFAPYEERLSNIISQAEWAPGLARDMASALEANPDDHEAWARFKAGIEGAMLGVALGSTIEGFKRAAQVVGVHKAFKRGDIDAAAAQKRATDIADAPYDYDEALAVFHGNHESVIVTRHRADLELDAARFVSDGVDPDDVGEYMWHSGTRGKQILKDGLKSRDQLADGTSGLGGGSSHTISVTYSREHAENINAMQKLMSRLSRDEAGLDDFLDHFSYMWDEMQHYGIDRAVRNLESLIGRDRVDALRNARRELDMAEEDELWKEFLRDKRVVGKKLSAKQERDLEIEFAYRLEQRNLDEFSHLNPIENISDFAEAFGRVLDDLSPDDRRRALVRLAQVLDEADDELVRKTVIVGDVDEVISNFARFDPEDIQIFQVGAHKDVQPISQWDHHQVSRFGGDAQTVSGEFEIRFHPDDVELLERIVARNEQQAAALDWMIRWTDGKPAKLPQAKVRTAVEKIVARSRSGVSNDDPMMYADIGLNLGLFVKTHPDFARVSGSVAKAMRGLHEDARFKPEGAPKTFVELEERSMAEFKRLFGDDVTNADLRQWADELGAVSLDDAAVMVDAGMKVLNAMAQDISRVARAYDMMDGPEKVGLQKLLEEMTDSFAHVQLKVLGRRSEGGRLLNFLKKAGRSPDEMAKTARAAKDALEAGAERQAEKLTQAQALELARNLRLAEGDAEMVRKVIMHTADLHRGWNKDLSLMDKINWFRTGMLLSGPKTFAINLINNAFTAWQVPIEHWYAGVRGGDKALAEFGRDELAGNFAFVMDAFRMARKTWTTNMNTLDPNKSPMEGLQHGPEALSWIGSAAKTLVDLPGRALMTTDEFFKQMTYRSHVRAQALMMARQDLAGMGIAPGTKEYRERLAERVAEAMEGAFTKEGHGLNPTAMEHARYVTFQNDLGDHTMGGKVKSLVNEFPVFRFVMPFVRTPINLFRFAYQRTPILGRFQHQMREDLAAGGQRAMIAKARLEMGWVIWGTGATLVMGNKIVGAGPSDPQLRREWREMGFQPYSLRFANGDQISYNRIEPLATAVGIIADAAEAASELGEEDGTQIAYAVFSAIASSVTSKTFLVGLSDFLGAVEEGDPFKTRQAMRNAAASFTPNFVNQVNWDDSFREARSLVDEYRKRVPGLSHTLEPRRNLFGEKVMKPAAAVGMDFISDPMSQSAVANWANRSLNPFTTMRVEEDWETFRQLTDLGKALPYPQRFREEGNIDLSDRKKYDNGTRQSPYDRMFELVSDPTWGAPPLRQALRELVQSDTFQRDLAGGNEAFKGGGRYEAARSLVRRYYQMAEAQVMQEYPLLMAEMQRLKGVKIDGYFQNTTQLGQDEALWRPGR